jgi:co-chaperonin GroES (HSP10)
MKAMHHFIVELENQFHDTITTKGGIKFHIDPKWNEFEYRVVEGPVKALPAKHDTPVGIGDTLYFHHLVVLQDGQRLGGTEKDFLVLYDPITCVSNQAIAYKDQMTGEVKPLGDWCLLSPIPQEDDVTSDVIEVVQFKKKPPKTAKLWRGNAQTMEMGLTEGDIVGFKKNMDYSLMIDGQEKYRVDAGDLLFVYND